MPAVEYSTDSGVGVITLANPPVNAFSRTFAAQLREAVLAIADSKVRAVLTKAEGPNFCAGADVKMFVGLDRREGAGLVADALSLIALIEAIPVPTVCAVQGMCIAAGMELMLAHDLAIVGKSAQIGQTEAMIGTATLAGGAQRIAARAGIARAKEMVFSGKTYGGDIMKSWGIVNDVVADDDLNSTALGLARKLAAGPTAALAIDKAAINAASGPGFSAADQALRAAAGTLFETSDKRRGVEAFLERGARTFADGSLTFEGS